MGGSDTERQETINWEQVMEALAKHKCYSHVKMLKGEFKGVSFIVKGTFKELKGKCFKSGVWLYVDVGDGVYTDDEDGASTECVLREIFRVSSYSVPGDVSAGDYLDLLPKSPSSWQEAALKVLREDEDVVLVKIEDVLNILLEWKEHGRTKIELGAFRAELIARGLGESG